MAVKAGSVNRVDEELRMEFRGKVFAAQGIESVELRVDDDGAIRVWDCAADHWTTCHSISDRNCRAIRRAAAATT